MTNPMAKTPQHQSMSLLSRLLLTPMDGDDSSSQRMATLRSDLLNISRGEFDDLVTLASSNHVIVRGREIFLEIMHEAKDGTRTEWAQAALATERERIGTALGFLEEICSAFEHEDYNVAVIKSLDHWPDLGSDLDLYTNSDSEVTSKFMVRRFNA